MRFGCVGLWQGRCVPPMSRRFACGWPFRGRPARWKHRLPAPVRILGGRVLTKQAPGMRIPRGHFLCRNVPGGGALEASAREAVAVRRLMRRHLSFAVGLWWRQAPHLIRLTSFGLFPSRERLFLRRCCFLPRPFKPTKSQKPRPDQMGRGAVSVAFYQKNSVISGIWTGRLPPRAPPEPRWSRCPRRRARG